jgi:adenylyltransferase/sulfurtransferase
MNTLTIKPETLRKMIAEKPHELFILDVRNPSEYREYNINGYLIPFMDLPARLHELPTVKDTFIVVHCQHGVRSHHAVEFLRHEGYLNSYSLEGGIEAFRNL